MGLAQAWRRRGIWATAVILVLPAALALAVVSGGLHGLDAVSQIVTGPQVPQARLASHTGKPRRVVTAPPTVPAGAPGASAAAGAAAPTAAPAAGGAPGGPTPTAVAPPRRPASPAPAAGTPSASAPPQARPPAPPAGPVHQAGAPVAQAVGTVPGPAGPAGADAVTRVMDIVEPPPTLRRALPVP